MDFEVPKLANKNAFLKKRSPNFAAKAVLLFFLSKGSCSDVTPPTLKGENFGIRFSLFDYN